jgi:hypothetical protein
MPAARPGPGARDGSVRPVHSSGMADRPQLERDVEEIRAQLDWVRGYL